MNKKKYLTIDLRVICVVLIIIVATMLAFWRPWEQTKNVRKLTVTGQSTVKATPDEFVFNPYFERSGTDVSALKNELNQYGNKLQVDLKKQGIKESDITLDSSSYDRYYAYSDQSDSQTITLQVQITTPNKGLAQKVQDYLAGTDAKGQLTASPSFSDKKQKLLESDARQEAIQDARKKANQTAKDLNVTVGKVLEVDTQQDLPLLYRSSIELGAADSKSQASLPVTPGKQDVTMSVRVVFALQ